MRRKQQKKGETSGALSFLWNSRPVYSFSACIAVLALFFWMIPGIADLLCQPGVMASLFQSPMSALVTASHWIGGFGAGMLLIIAIINCFRAPAADAVTSSQPWVVGTNPAAPRETLKIPFIRKDLMTATELAFFKQLLVAFPDLHVCPQVALAAIIDIPAEFNNNRYKHANRAPFAAKFADFVLVEPDAGEVLAIIELDDYTHDSKERKAEDVLRDAMFAEVDIEVLRVDARKVPDVAALRAWFEA